MYFDYKVRGLVKRLLHMSLFQNVSISLHFWGSSKKAFRKVWTSTRFEISHLSFDYTKFDTNAMQKCRWCSKKLFWKRNHSELVVSTGLIFFVSFTFHLRRKAQALPHFSGARSATQKSSKKGPQYLSPRYSVVNNCVMLVTVINKGPGCRISQGTRGEILAATLIQETMVKGQQGVGIFQENEFVVWVLENPKIWFKMCFHQPSVGNKGACTKKLPNYLLG